MKIILLVFASVLLATVSQAEGIFEIRLGQDLPGESLEKFSHNGLPLWISNKVEMTSTMIAKAEYKWAKSPLSEEEVEKFKKENPDVYLSDLYLDPYIELWLTFTEEGAEKQEALTAENVGKVLVFMFNGEILTAPRIQMKISGNIAVVTGQLTEEKAKEIVKAIEAKKP